MRSLAVIVLLVASSPLALGAPTAHSADTAVHGFLPMNELGMPVALSSPSRDIAPVAPRLLAVDELGQPRLPLSRKAPAGCSTNAECLRKGLPLLSPRMRKVERQDPQPSGVPSTVVNGRLRIADAATGAVVGYLSDQFYSGVVLGTTTNPASAAVLTFDPASSTSTLNIRINADAAFPYLCGVQGPSSPSPDLISGQYNFAVITACATPLSAGSPPTNTASKLDGNRASETAIFGYDTVSSEIGAQWTNTDLSFPGTFAMYTPTDEGNGFLSLTGDVDAFRNAFGANRIAVRYSFEKI